MGLEYLNNDAYMASLTEAEYDEALLDWEWPGIPSDISVYKGTSSTTAAEVSLPHLYRARDYQSKEVWTPFFEEQYRRLCVIWHRRAGKDKTIWNITVAAAMQRVGLYLYMLPKLNQAKKVIWDGRGRDGISFRDHVPEIICVKQNSSTMTIYLVNGSIIQLGGSDSYDSLMGTNPLGIVFSEYSLQDPHAWTFFRPILAENGGWAIMDYTPRGRNHGYKLMEIARKSKNWHLSLLTADDTKRPDGSPVVTEENIQAEIDDGMSEDEAQQEFFCSFDAANKGAIFGKEMRRAREEGRVRKIPIERHLRTFTFWDLGFNDYMALWIMQPFSGTELRFIGYYQHRGEGMEHYINWLLEFQKKYDIAFETHYAPHDIEVHELMEGKARIDTAKEMGIEFETVERTKAKEDSIEAGIRAFPYCYFDEERCEMGINALSDYERIHNEKNDTYGKPLHNWASNGADAYQQFSMIWSDKILEIRKAQIKKKPRKKGFM